MKQVTANWKQGWPLFGRWLFFTVLVGLWLIPISIVEFFLKSKGLAMFDDNGFHWQPCVTLVMAVILLPIAFAYAQKQTGFFKNEDKDHRT